jgi:predicted amidohydrolase
LFILREVKSTRLVIAVAQMKFRPAIFENVAWIVRTIQSSAKAGADLLLLPECAVTGYNRDFTRIGAADIEAALETIARAARQARCHVLVGCPTFSG